jgi:transcriptional regulator of acetoin/glycerol metabolism
MRAPDDPTQGSTITDPAAAHGPLPVERFGILWVTPEERFTPITEGTVFGRGDAADVVIEGGSVSRVHAKVRRQGPLFMLEDLGSKNGTRVNGFEARLAPLEQQTIVRLGEWVGVACVMREPLPPANDLFVEVAPGWLAAQSTLARLGPLLGVAESNIAVVLLGETGTGKEVAARSIHHLSGRHGRFVALNCAAIPENVAEAELFGHRKGAFTGAATDREGFIGAAAGGTLFLDEIGDLPASIQSKLLRVLEGRAVTQLGSTTERPVDFRLVAASQEPLASLVDAGTFRGDLYARLGGAEVHLPPLRQRREEVIRLFRRATEGMTSTPPALSAAFCERLCVYNWPFNVREVVQLARLVSVTKHGTLAVDDLPERMAPVSAGAEVPSAEPQFGRGRREAWMLRHAHELARLKEALGRTKNVSRAAREAGIPRYRALRLLEAEQELKRGDESDT